MAIDHLRQPKARHRLLENVPLPDELPPLGGEALFFRRALERLAADIPPEELEAVILGRLDQLTQVEIVYWSHVKPTGRVEEDGGAYSSTGCLQGTGL